MDDEDKPTTQREAVYELDQVSGQTYYLSVRAFEFIEPFASDATEDFVAEYSNTESAITAASRRLKEVQRSAIEARGLLSVYPHRQVVTIAETSDIICEMLGLEPNESSGLGGGFREDSRHSLNMEDIMKYRAEQVTEE